MLLNRDGNLDENVVLSFGFYPDVELLNAQVHLCHNLFDPGQLKIRPRPCHTYELAETLHNGRLGRCHGKQSGQYRADPEQYNKHEQNSYQYVRRYPPQNTYRNVKAS